MAIVRPATLALAVPIAAVSGPSRAFALARVRPLVTSTISTSPASVGGVEALARGAVENRA